MAKFGMAQPVRRVEDPRLLLGAGRYTDDFAPADTAIGIVLRSPYAAATITRIDVTAARAAPGVLGVYTRRRPQGRRHRTAPLRHSAQEPRRHRPRRPAPFRPRRRRRPPCRRPPSPSSSPRLTSRPATRRNWSRSNTTCSRASPTSPSPWSPAPRSSGPTSRTTSSSTGRPATRPAPTNSSPKPPTSPS